MNIRPATSLDLPAIAALHGAITAELHALAPTGFGGALETLPGRGDVAGKFRDMLDDSDCVLLVAEEDARVIGYASGWREAHDDDVIAAPFFTIEYVSVQAEQRGHGAAHELVAALEAEARRRGLGRVDIRVLEANTHARELYAGLGYHPLEMRLGKVL